MDKHSSRRGLPNLQADLDKQFRCDPGHGVVIQTSDAATHQASTIAVGV